MMSVQSASLASATFDSAPIRRERAQPDRERSSEAFTLPEPAREPQSRRANDDKPVQARTDETPKSGETRRPDATAPETAAVAASDKADKPARDDPASTKDPASKTDATIGEKIVGSEVKGAALKADATGKPLIEALAALAAAVEGAGAGLTVEAAEAATKTEGDVVVSAEGAAVPEAGKPDPNAIVAAEAQPAPVATPQAVPLLDAAVLLAAAAVSPASTEATAEAKGDGSEPEAATEVKPAATPALPQPSRGPGRAGEVSLALAARESLTEKTTPDVKFGEIVAAAGAAQAKDGADAAKAAPAEGKPVDAPQAPQAPIDLSFLTQTRARAETAIVIPASSEADHAAKAGAQAQSSGPATPIHVVPIEIGLQAMAGSKRFDIRLDPAELGRVDVNLEISDKGEVTARLVVDRVETLHMLQRDARTLERAFEQAGLKSSDAGVDITLRDPSDQSGFRQNRQDDETPRRARPATGPDGGEDIAIAAQAAPARRQLRLGGVDLSI